MGVLEGECTSLSWLEGFVYPGEGDILCNDHTRQGVFSRVSRGNDVFLKQGTVFHQ